jgi:hypothetical protein
MKHLIKLPLYLGILLLIISVTISVSEVGKQGFSFNTRTKANISGATLGITYTSPDIVSILLNSQSDVAGVDVVVKYDNTKIEILPSTLRSNNPFITMGGMINDKDSSYSFSAIVKGNGVKSGIVASFNIKPRIIGELSQTEMFITSGEGKSSVVQKDTNSNILIKSEGIKFSF